MNARVYMLTQREQMIKGLEEQVGVEMGLLLIWPGIGNARPDVGVVQGIEGEPHGRNKSG